MSAIDPLSSPAEGATPDELAAWAVDTGRIDGKFEDTLAGMVRAGRTPREHVVASPPLVHDNRLYSATRTMRQEMAALKASFAASDAKRTQKVAAAAPARPYLDPIDLALEDAFPAFPDEVAQVKATQTVQAAAAPARGGALPGAREALGQLYHAATGRPWTVQASASQEAAPEPFSGSGDLPAATASGMDPALLGKARWQDRWAIAKAPTQAEAATRLNDSIAIAKDFGDLSTAWPPTGLDDDAAAYVQAYSRHLSGFPAQGSSASGRMSG